MSSVLSKTILTRNTQNKKEKTSKYRLLVNIIQNLTRMLIYGQFEFGIKYDIAWPQWISKGQIWEVLLRGGQSVSLFLFTLKSNSCEKRKFRVVPEVAMLSGRATRSFSAILYKMKVARIYFSIKSEGCPKCIRLPIFSCKTTKLAMSDTFKH